MERKEKIGIIGAGLCGTLMAIRLAQLGYDVDLMERRGDMRKQEVDAGRSINLALSHRGLRALEMIGLRTQLADDIIPMYGRLIHDESGSTKLYKYSGREDEYINSVSRGGLNSELLTFAEKFENLSIDFDAPCVDVNIDTNELILSKEGVEEKRQYDVLIGADGAGSVLRMSFQEMSNRIRFDYSQKYLDTGYKELSIPPGKDASFQIEKHVLHIWPRDGHMMIALPNTDGSFTLTLFIRFEGENSMEELESTEAAVAFMKKHYGDAVPFMSELQDEWVDNPTSSLGMIKCYPWVHKNAVLLGDSAHAIVPFYGQGMNCAFEDCVVLDGLIEKHKHDWSRILPAYQEHRKIDADAIGDLAIDNFYEMRDDTANPVFNRKRQIELKLETDYPDYYSKYGLVTFRPDLRYHQAMNLGRRQDTLLMQIAEQYQDVSAVPYDEVYEQVMALAEG